MFSPTFRRIVCSASSFSTASASCLLRPVPPAYPPSHPRRQSSSKPSTPPKSKKKPAEIERNAAAELQGSEKRAEGRQKKMKRASAPPQVSNIPMVPPTNHLREDDVKISAFFGLHRPISIQNAVPSETPIHEFNAIFDLYSSTNAQAIQRTKALLSNFIQRMYAEIDAQEEQRADAAQAQAQAQPQPQPQVEIYHLNALPTQQTVENWVARLIPFSPPAAPIPHDPLATKSSLGLFSVYDVSASSNQRVTEIPLPSSQKARLSVSRNHVAKRRHGMLLISVKRQRKLKMKKHKYKKLMKRTRLMRRKLDRL